MATLEKPREDEEEDEEDLEEEIDEIESKVEAPVNQPKEQQKSVPSGVNSEKKNIVQKISEDVKGTSVVSIDPKTKEKLSEKKVQKKNNIDVKNETSVSVSQTTEKPKFFVSNSDITKTEKPEKEKVNWVFPIAQKTSENMKSGSLKQKSKSLADKLLQECNVPDPSEFSELAYPIFSDEKEFTSNLQSSPSLPEIDKQSQSTVNVNDVKMALKSEEVDIKPLSAMKDPKIELVREKSIPQTLNPLYPPERQLKKFSNVIFMSINGNIVTFDCANYSAMNTLEKCVIWKAKVKGLGATLSGNTASPMTLYFTPLSEVLYASMGRSLIAFNANNGTLLWKSEKKLRHWSNSILALDEGIWTVGVSHVRLWDKKTGKEKVHLKLKGAWNIFTKNFEISTFLPSKDNKSLYVFAANGISKISRKSLSIEYIGDLNSVQNGLEYFDSTHIILCQNGHVNLYNKKTRKSVRKTKIFKVFNYGIAMLLRNSDTLIITSSNKFMAMHPLTHEKYWVSTWHISDVPLIVVKNTPVYLARDQSTLNQDEKNVYIAGAGRVAAIDIKTGDLKWKTRLGKSPKMYVSTILNVEKNLLIAGCRGYFFGIDTRNGKILYSNRMKGYAQSHITFAHYSKFSNNSSHSPEQPFLSANWCV